ncbi:amino acid adenylation domain-containing protein [Micromonospora globbae]|uniref:amino acid adenylation domain-containing protein n=1 Tax=Micromonospora globbae TaxID=1894969 RepID=UPI0034408080
MTEEAMNASMIRVQAPAGFDLGTQESPPAMVHELISERTSRQPDAPALDGLSYRELDSWAERIARVLAHHGVRPGLPVAIRLPAGDQHVATLLGVLKAGCFLLPLSPSDPIERCVDAIRDIKPACLLVGNGSDADELISWYRTATSGAVLSVPARDDAVPENAPAPAAGHDRLDALAYIVYTSGTTGRPKGIVQSHRGLAQLVLWMGAEFRMGLGRRTAQWASPSYDASLCEIFATLIAGGTLCTVPNDIRFDAGLLVEWLAAQRVNILQTVPSFARELRYAIDSAAEVPDLTSLDHILFAGEALPGDLAAGLSAALPGIRQVNLYGTTEAILATWMEVNGQWTGIVPIGRPIPGRSILVLDRDDNPCPVGVVGEIVICSHFLTLGYVGETAASRSGFGIVTVSTTDGETRTIPSYRTGDEGFWRTDGLLEYRGRRDRQVKLRGIRVELTEIESVLVSHPSVVDCVVVASGDDGLVQQLVAYVVPAMEAGSPETWRAHLRRHLRDEMVPSAFVAMASLPRNVGGKVDTSRLPAPGEARRAGNMRSKRSSRLGKFRSWSGELVQRPGAEGAQGPKDTSYK